MSTSTERTGAGPIPKLRTALNGRVIVPDDDGYNEARAVFYGWINRRPAVIARAVDATDVSRVVSIAREAGLALAVRSGGHSLAGHSVSDGGIVLDLSDMRAIHIDTEQRTAWAQSGLTAGAYTTAAGAHGLATGFGDTGAVGIGGLTLGGGVGFLVRKHGLTVDDLLAAEIVTADGTLLRVDAETHPDLFWAIRGGGGNFGVATRFQFRLHEIDSIVGGMLMLPASADVIVQTVITRRRVAGGARMETRSHVPLVPGATGLNAFLWFIQVFLAIQYLFHGWIFVSPPAVMAEAIAGMGLSPGFRQFIGIAEILASIGLLLPGLTRTLPWLTPLAAFGLTIVMASAAIFHISRNEVPNAISSANLLLLVAVTAYLRWKVVPILSRAAR